MPRTLAARCARPEAGNSPPYCLSPVRRTAEGSRYAGPVGIHSLATGAAGSFRRVAAAGSVLMELFALPGHVSKQRRWGETVAVALGVVLETGHHVVESQTVGLT